MSTDSNLFWHTKTFHCAQLHISFSYFVPKYDFWVVRLIFWYNLIYINKQCCQRTHVTSFEEFLNATCNFEHFQNGLVSAIPYLCQWIVANLAGQLADLLRSRHILSTTTARKLFNTMGKLGFYPTVLPWMIWGLPCLGLPISKLYDQSIVDS